MLKMTVYASCSLLFLACGGAATPESGEPGSGSVRRPGSNEPGASDPSRLDGLELARRLAEPDAVLSRLLSPDNGAFRADGGSLVSPSWDEAGVDRFREVTARLPLRSSDTFAIGLGRIARFGLQLKLEGVTDVPATIEGGSVVYHGAFRSTDVVWTALDDRAEELLVLRRPDAPRDFAWRVALPSGIGSVRRERSGGLVFSDRRGDSVLRVPPPYAIDARGTRRDAALEWSDGLLSVHVDTAALEYPVLVDPAVEVVLWEEITPLTTTPAPRTDAQMVYDSGRGLTLLYGGYDGSNAIGETWGWNGSDWALIDQTTSPARSGFSLAYDSVANVSVMFGGCSNETWQLSGSTWSTVSPVDSPSSRRFLAMAYEGPPPDGSGKILLFGGYQCTAPEQAMADTWEWNGTNWTESFPSPAPDARTGHAMVYDTKRHEAVLFGGFGDGASCCSGTNDCMRKDTWTWNGSDWTNENPAKSPPGRNAHQMAYDSATGRTVMFGGNNCPFLGDTWEWDGSTWKETTPATSPAVRQSSGMAYDPARGRVVLFGGVDASGTLEDTWEYHSHGAACASDTECDTGHCVDGVCCEQSVCGQCEACDTVAKPGVCAPVTNAQDDSCTGTMACDGAGACQVFQGTDCTTSCPLGLFCVDEICCSTACTGQCEACDVAGSVGTCAPVLGKPHDTRAPCTGQGTTCGGVCGGTDRQACVYPDASKSCRTGGCTNATLTATAGCDGAGACPPLAATSCGLYACDSQGTACETACSTDAGCSSTGYCTAPSCTAKSAIGGACTADRECLSNHCADGFCCDTACNGQCEACNVGGINGVCQTVNGNPVAPRSPCTGTGTTCGGTCDGTNPSCTYADTTVPCRAASCTADVATSAATCDGAGTCPLVTQDCSPLHCSAAGPGCDSNCDASRPCQNGYYCDTGICRPLLGDGVSCPLGDFECQSGHCVGGLCCDTACQGQCEACDVVPGSCIPVIGAPHAGKPACGGTGTCAGDCDGNDRTTCVYPDSGTECRAASCAADVAILNAGCDGTGSCPPLQTQACAPYVCGATQCLGDCPNGDPDCQNGKYCSAGICKDKLPIGTLCGGGNQCASGHCADGVCCGTDCKGQCEACNEPAKEGICTLVTGVPRGTRAGCGGTGTCKQSCDGKTAASCTYPGVEVECAGGSCKNGTETTASTCDGAGACTTATTAICGAYACGSDECKRSCTGPSDCAIGNGCLNGACVPIASTDAGTGGATGSSGATGSGGGPGTGGKTATGGAAGGSNGAAGSGSPDSDSGTDGSASSFEEPPMGQDSGCGCRTAPHSGTSTQSLLVALGLGASLARRRNRARRNPISRA